jgi:phenylpropionate dioxygenase-like ring-hydroxylating dioxygenase large terminal subunit
VRFRDASGRRDADRCCHRAPAPRPGGLGECGIQYRCHGLVFDADGPLRDDPRQKLIQPDARVRGYPTVEKGQLVWS